jgi:membrane protein implicated in regulation of membrane protease activity
MEKVLEFLLAIGILLIVVLIIGLPVMWLWNWLMPLIFGLTKISFLQALGLSLLGNMLFNSGVSNKQTKQK